MRVKPKIIFAGTGEFGHPSLQKIIENFQVVGIITQPDRKSNRGLKIASNPIKKLAIQYNIKLFQPEKIIQIYDQLKELDFDIFLTASFGQYVPSKILELAKLGSLNIHGSILPKYRGAAPVQHALWNGETTTGITLIYMTKVMDAGDMLAKAKVPISLFDNTTTLLTKLSSLASEHIINWLQDFSNGKLLAQKQDESQATSAPKILKEEAELNLNDNADNLINKIRAFANNPGAYIIYNNKRLKIIMAIKNLTDIDTRLHKHPALIKLQAKDNEIYLVKYQFEGKQQVNLL